MSWGRRLVWQVGALCLIIAQTPAGHAESERSGAVASHRADIQLAGFLEQGVGDGGYEYLAALQRFATLSGGTRSSGTAGHTLSIAYFAGLLRKAGYLVSRQTVPYLRFVVDAEHLETAGHRSVGVMMARNSPSLPADGIWATVVALTPERAGQPVKDMGCAPSDYAGLPVAGSIVMVPRASCSRTVQAGILAGLGGRAMLEYWVVPNRDYLIRGNIVQPSPIAIPIGDIAPETAYRIAGALPGSVRMHLALHGSTSEATTENLFAQTRHGDIHHVVMAGAHLDSVPEGPGINDNGSTAAALLRSALRLAPAQQHVRNAVRFAFWGAEEFVVLGSSYYVSQLSIAQQQDIMLYLNGKLLADHNNGRFVIDGAGAPAGSSVITDALTGYYRSRGLPSELISLHGIGSDHEPFAAAGIPVGGITGGTNGLKTSSQQSLFGGQAGQMYDRCYHTRCDDLGNINKPELAINAKALAWTVGYFATSGTGVRAPPDPRPKPRHAARSKP